MWYLMVEKKGKKAIALSAKNKQVLEDLKLVILAKGGGYTIEIIPGIDYMDVHLLEYISQLHTQLREREKLSLGGRAIYMPMNFAIG